MSLPRIKIGILRQLIIETIKNAYDLLGVLPSATDDEIKKAWINLAKRNHPDNKGGTHAALVDINMAKDHLLNNPKRKRNDMGFSPLFTSFNQQAAQPQHRQGPQPQNNQHKQITYLCPWCGRRVAGVPNTKGGIDFVNHYTVQEGNVKCEGSKSMSSQRSSTYTNSKQNDNSQTSSKQKNRDVYKIYPWKNGRRVVRVANKLYGTGPGGKLSNNQITRFNSNERAKVSQDGNRMKVSKTDSDHSQSWDPIEETRQIIVNAVIDFLTLC